VDRTKQPKLERGSVAAWLQIVTGHSPIVSLPGKRGNLQSGPSYCQQPFPETVTRHPPGYCSFHGDVRALRRDSALQQPHQAGQPGGTAVAAARCSCATSLRGQLALGGIAENVVVSCLHEVVGIQHGLLPPAGARAGLSRTLASLVCVRPAGAGLEMRFSERDCAIVAGLLSPAHVINMLDNLGLDSRIKIRRRINGLNEPGVDPGRGRP